MIPRTEKLHVVGDVERPMSAEALHDLIGIIRPAWHARAACRGMAVDKGDRRHPFFREERGEDKDPDWPDRRERAFAICDGCPVREKCDRYAVEGFEPHGIWGGRDRLPRGRPPVHNPALGRQNPRYGQVRDLILNELARDPGWHNVPHLAWHFGLNTETVRRTLYRAHARNEVERVKDKHVTLWRWKGES